VAFKDYQPLPPLLLTATNTPEAGRIGPVAAADLIVAAATVADLVGQARQGLP
jgi:hypothetical protein